MPDEFEGLERLEAREKIIAKLQETGLLKKLKITKIKWDIVTDVVMFVEPYISKQWFLKKEIVAKAIEKINANQSNFFPPQWKNNYNAWMKELRDWCISRQLWWGHQIPVFYCDSCSNKWASAKTQLQCPKCQSTNIHQDPDVLDTWFSSALWAFSTLGYGNGKWGEGTLWQKDDLQNFYPNSLLITGFDILFFLGCKNANDGRTFPLRTSLPQHLPPCSCKR